MCPSHSSIFRLSSSQVQFALPLSPHVYTAIALLFYRNREAHEHELEKAQMRIAERTRKGMAEESEEEDFSAGPVVPEGEEVAMVAFDGPKFKEVGLSNLTFVPYVKKP